MRANEAEIAYLEELYADRRAYFGELHNHAKTGGTADGLRTLSHWRGAMEALKMDFAAILDHKQVRHMFQEEWEDGLFIGGTEPGTGILDSKAEVKSMHYNMVFTGPEPLMELLTEFEEYGFTGGKEGHFNYPRFTTERFGELIDRVKEKGGFFVHPHPKQLMKSDDPLDYVFRDQTGLEVFYGDMANAHTALNYDLWMGVLAAGRRIWAVAGGDNHACADDRALNTIYAESRTNKAYLDHLREGDFVCGSVGIKMCIGDQKMGGSCSFAGKKLILSVADFHRSVKNPDHTYRVDIINDRGVVCSEEFSCTEPVTLSLETEPCAYYRAEVFDVNRNLRIAIGNPIWNDD